MYEILTVRLFKPERICAKNKVLKWAIICPEISQTRSLASEITKKTQNKAKNM